MDNDLFNWFGLLPRSPYSSSPFAGGTPNAYNVVAPPPVPASKRGIPQAAPPPQPQYATPEVLRAMQEQAKGAGDIPLVMGQGVPGAAVNLWRGFYPAYLEGMARQKAEANQDLENNAFNAVR